MHTLTTATAGISLTTLAISTVSGLVIPAVTDLVTKAKAPTALKTTIATLLAVLAGALTTVVYTPHERWQDYLVAIGLTIANSQAAHRILLGLGDPVQNLKPNAGIGPAPDPNTPPDPPLPFPVPPQDSYFPDNPNPRTSPTRKPVARARKGTARR
jgi:hypothetical protein